MGNADTSAVAPRASLFEECVQDCLQLWRQLPDKLPVFILVVSWVALFQFLGNSTLGYTETRSVFGWYIYATSGGYSDEDISRYVPVVVVILLVWKRKILLKVPKRQWWPALAILGAALALHTLGYFVQQNRASFIAFFVGLYAIGGLFWGREWLVATFFPFVLCGFCLPLSSEVDAVTFPMRLWAATITSALSQGLGINVIQNGTSIYDAAGAFQYDVAAACSGIRSLTLTLLFSIIFAFVSLRSPGRRLLIIASAFPLAIVANVVRLTMIIVAAEAFGQSAGNYVHESSWLGLLPYIPAFFGLGVLVRWMREDPEDSNVNRPGLHQPA
jgi:exosortase